MRLTFKESAVLEPQYINYLTKRGKKRYKHLPTEEKKKVLNDFSSSTAVEKEYVERKSIIEDLKEDNPGELVEDDITKISVNKWNESYFIYIDKSLRELEMASNPKKIEAIKLSIEKNVNIIIRNQYPTDNQLKWLQRAEKVQETGENLQNVGGKLMGAGAKTTAAVWTPALYLGYKGVKHASKKKSNVESLEVDSVEKSSLIEFVSNTEQALLNNVIDKETAIKIIKDYLDNKY